MTKLISSETYSQVLEFCANSAPYVVGRICSEKGYYAGDNAYLGGVPYDKTIGLGKELEIWLRAELPKALQTSKYVVPTDDAVNIEKSTRWTALVSSNASAVVNLAKYDDFHMIIKLALLKKFNSFIAIEDVHLDWKDTGPLLDVTLKIKELLQNAPSLN